MKKNFLMMGLLVMGLGMTVASCGDDDDNNNATAKTEEETAADLDYTSENAAAWGNYAKNVAALLKEDASNLDNQWESSFAADFKNHTSGSGYASAEACVEQMIDGCIDIANEVGTSKIGEPYDLYISGKKTQALYAVESWYSWHSRDDYKNNILSIANTYLNTLISEGLDTYSYASLMAQGSNAPASIMTKCAVNADLRPTAILVWQDIVAAWKAIDAIPQPFRNNIGSTETTTAMTACAQLVTDLNTLKGKIGALSESDCQAIVNNFVDVVALPTYANLKAKNAALYDAVSALQANPSNSTFEAACTAWLAARQPWETSEAFLFGPVADLGLDPNMDSWPLDQVGISNLIKSQKWSEMTWSGDYDEESEAIEAAQSLRGFHTLEFLLFKDGQPRTIK